MLEIVTAIVALSSLIISFWTLRSNAKYKEKFDPDGVGADYNAVRTAKDLLSNPRVLARTFTVLNHYIGGYDPDELRKILVRAGAVRVTSKDRREMWVLRSRMAKYTRNPHDFEPVLPAPNTRPDECYFPKLEEMPVGFDPEAPDISAISDKHEEERPNDTE